MSDKYEERVMADEVRAQETLELQKIEVARVERETRIREDDWKTFPARTRAQHHHDILARVVMMLLAEHANDWDLPMVTNAVQCARIAADLAYPPEAE